MNFIDKLILITFPFMDVGFILFGVPFRLGEFVFFLFFLRILEIDLSITKINKSGFIILLLILLNLLLTMLVKSFWTVDVDEEFYSKYVLRNTLYFFAMLSFVFKPIKYNQIKFEFFIKYFLYVVLVFYLIEYVDFYLFGFDWSNSVFVSRQGKSVFNDFLIRFSGPSSEPAYIIPLLSIPLMYGFVKRKMSYSIISIISILLTFSSFGYLVIFLSVFYYLNNYVDKELKQKAKNLVFYILILLSFLGVVFANKVGKMIAYNWEKFQAYFGIGDVYEWSAAQRSGHIKLAFNLFWESSWFSKLVGNGTGYYSKMSKEFDKYYLDDAEEAHSLYFSTLTDRGIIGLLIIILLLYTISKINIPKNVSGDIKYFFTAIKFGAIVRIFHWAFTGMLWQYYFWVEVAILISASAYYIKISNERR